MLGAFCLKGGMKAFNNVYLVNKRPKEKHLIIEKYDLCNFKTPIRKKNNFINFGFRVFLTLFTITTITCTSFTPKYFQHQNLK